MRAVSKPLKPTLSAQMPYSQAMRELAPEQINSAIASLISKFATRIKYEQRTVDWTTLKVTDQFIKSRDQWVAVVTVEEVKP